MVNTDLPLVSICIPTYCRYELLRRAVDSALAQDLGGIEILVSDNYSEDGSWDKTKLLMGLDPRIIVRRNERNLGWTGNLNGCIKDARGKYLVFLCDDDVLLPGMARESCAFMEAHPKAGFVHTAGYGIGLSGRRNLVSCNSAHPAIIKAGLEALNDTAFAFDILFSSVMVRAECFRNLGGFTESISSDYEMWSRISAVYDVGYIPKPLICVYAHPISPKMTAERYITESTRLSAAVLQLFPPAIRNSSEVRDKSARQLANGLRSLGLQAMYSGYWGRGVEFLRFAAKYSPEYGLLRRAMDVLRAVPRRLVFIFYIDNSAKTHV